MPEDERGGQAQPGRRGQPVPYLHGGEGVEAEVGERHLGRHRVGAAMPEHRRRVRADQVDQDVVLLGSWQGREQATPLGGRGIRHRCLSHPATDEGTQQRRRGVRGSRGQRAHVEVDGEQPRVAVPAGRVEQPEGPLG